MDKKASIKQVVLYSVMNYIGTAIGIFSVLFIYPLNNEFAGIVRHIDNISMTPLAEWVYHNTPAPS